MKEPRYRKAFFDTHGKYLGTVIITLSVDPTGCLMIKVVDEVGLLDQDRKAFFDLPEGIRDLDLLRIVDERLVRVGYQRIQTPEERS